MLGHFRGSIQITLKTMNPPGKFTNRVRIIERVMNTSSRNVFRELKYSNESDSPQP